MDQGFPIIWDHQFLPMHLYTHHIPHFLQCLLTLLTIMPLSMHIRRRYIMCPIIINLYITNMNLYITNHPCQT